MVTSVRGNKKRRERAPAKPFITAFQPDEGELLNPSSAEIIAKKQGKVKLFTISGAGNE